VDTSAYAVQRLDFDIDGLDPTHGTTGLVAPNTVGDGKGAANPPKTLTAPDRPATSAGPVLLHGRRPCLATFGWNTLRSLGRRIPFADQM
jgi:hypothetical protein